MKVLFHESAFKDYIDWQTRDKQTLKKINDLIKDISRHPFEGLGKPEALRHQLKGYWSRRINHEDRLIYVIEGDNIIIISCKSHYEK